MPPKQKQKSSRMTNHKSGRITLKGAEPMEFTPEPDGGAPSGLSEETRQSLRLIGECFIAYLKATEKLVAGKYSGIAKFVPEYMAHPGNFMVALCPDGLVARFERKSSENEKRKWGSAYVPHGIAQTTLDLSQHLVMITGNGINPPDPSMELGVELRMGVYSPTGSLSRELMAARLLFQVEHPDPLPPSASPCKPYCLLSIRNQLSMEIHGDLVPVDGSSGPSQPFVSIGEFEIPVGWQCIEVYPSTDISGWKPEYAPLWAETDLLACAFIGQQAAAAEASIDPRASTRRKYAALLAEFKALLDSNPEREQTLQAFLQANPELLHPTKTQMWPKLAFGKHITDFVFRDAVNDYLLVELERSTLRLFKNDGHATTDLNHAHGQILDWKRYIEDNLATVQKELGLTGISSNAAGLIVIGRSSELDADTRRKLTTMANTMPKLRIMTYDDVYENAKAVLENFLGPMTDIGGTTRIYYPPAQPT
jgi:hypothetical protein